MKDTMGILEFMMLFCFCFSWPFSIIKSFRSRSTSGKSILFMLLIIAGYGFGIIHKIMNGFDWVTWAYVAGLLLVTTDTVLYWRNRRLEKSSVSTTEGSTVK